MKPRIAAIGIDAAEWKAVQDAVDAGLLPNIEKVLDASAILGVHGEMPYRAEASWTEFLAARSPGETRYWTTGSFDPSSYDMWEVGAYRGVPFYARPDLNVIAYDVPHSHIAPEGRGVQITGWGAHSPQFPTASAPRDLVARIDRRFGVHEAVAADSYDGWHNAEYGRNLTDALLRGLDRKAEISAWLLDEYPDWDLFVTVLSETHTGGHHFLHGVLDDHPLHDLPLAAAANEHLHAIYRKVDETVGRLTAMVDDATTVVLFAVHGMQTNGSDTANVWLPELLHRLSFDRPFIDAPVGVASTPLIQVSPHLNPLEYLLRYLTEPRGAMYGSRTSALRNQVAWTLRHRVPPALLDKALGAARRAMGHAAQHRWWELEVRPPASPDIDLALAASRRPCDYHVPAWWCSYWPQMRYFVIPSFSDVHLRVNLRGRERDGVVDLDAYHDVLDEIDVLLGRIVNARTGRPVVGRTYRVRETDPMAPDGPSADLVVTLDDVADMISYPGVGVIGPYPIFRAGEHSTNGWAAFRTPQGPFGVLAPGRPRDLGPTMLDLLDRPASPLVTGTSMAPFLRRA